ncbi:MAG TPA: CopD family protein [Solirubrobacteraceae bacterium]|nr:CopD family protein [Solirubrobacteraceae bacterium]
MSALRALVAAVALLAAAPAAASAHAVLQSTVPERGAALDAPPGEVRLRFTEPVEARFGAIRVFDAAGREVQAGEPFHPGGRGAEIAVRLRPGLGDGGYTLTYRVISADSHPVSGGVVFAVGEAGAGARSVEELLEGTQSGPVTTTALSAARAVQFGAIALALGALLFWALCWRGALRDARSGEPGWDAAATAFAGRLRRLLVVAAGAGVLSGAAGIVLQGATGAGTSFFAALDVDVIRDVLGTRFGVVWGLGAAAWVAVLVLALAAPAVAAVPVAALALLPALGGHAGTQEPRWLMLPANLVHVAAVSAWIGGIGVLVLALRGATRELGEADRTRLLAGAVARFSTVAGAAFALILASGIAQSLAAVDAPGQLLDTAYGRALLIKLALFALLVGLGFVNRNRLLPALRRAAAGATAPGRAGVLLRRTLRAELALGVIVLGVTGALATYPPAESVAAGPFATSAPLGPARLEITVDPAQVGPNAVHLYLFDRRTGAQWDEALEVRARAALPEADVEALPIELARAGPGHYTAEGAAFVADGDWRLTVTARVSEFDQHEARLTVPIDGSD